MLDDTPTATDYGRDHHPRCYSVWMAGGGIKGGVVHGETDEFSYNIVKDPVHIRDFQSTILNWFGIDSQRFRYKYQGLDQRLTGVEKGFVRKNRGWIGAREACQVSDRARVQGSGKCESRRIFS